MPKLSIIIPVYNVEQYIRECLDSVKNQTFTNFEVLLVDDGSPDSSGAICDEYAATDSRFKVFHKENGGVASARNLGLDNANGEWITFIDPDDFLSTNKAYEQIFDNDLNIVDLLNFGFVWDLGSGKSNVVLPNDIGLDTSKPIIQKNDILNYIQSFRNVWTIIVRNDKIGKLRFDSLKTGEDSLFVQSLLFQVKTILVINKAFVFYRYVMSSTTKKYMPTFASDRIHHIQKIRNLLVKSLNYDKKSFDLYCLEILIWEIENELQGNNISTSTKKIRLLADYLKIDEFITWNKVFEGGRIWIVRLLLKLRTYRFLLFLAKKKYISLQSLK